MKILRHHLLSVCALALLGAACLPAFAAQAGGETATEGKPKTARKASGERLSLEAAIAKALLQSPRLQAFRSAVSAAEGESRQAGARQNPEVSYSKENFAAGAAYKVVSPAQDVYGVSQLVEIGGKITARKEVADKGLEIASLNHQAATLDLIRDVTVAYAEAVAAEENVRLAAEQESLAQEVLAAVSTRVNAAAAPQIQKSRADVERHAASIALNTAKREQEIARKYLATLMGEVSGGFTLDSKAFFAIARPETSAVEESLKAGPDLRKQASLQDQAKARLDLEKANAIPDPRIAAGLTRIPSANGQALMVGVSLPIPVLNANRGNIQRARSDVSRAGQEARQAELLLGSELTRASQQLENAYLQATTLKTMILPSAQKAFALAREGYGLGRFPYLEVLDAQRSLFDVKRQHISASRDYHIARAAVERLTAAYLPKLQNTGELHVE